MYNVSIPMALMDFVPVIFFGITMVLLQRDLYNKMFKGAYALFAAGTINVFLAGFLKATWKLLYAAGACDFAALDAMFFPVQSLGFLMAGIAVLLMVVSKKHKNAMLAVAAPPVFSGTFLFVGLMVAGLGCMNGGLIALAAKEKKVVAIICFVLSFLCSLCMGYLSSQDFTQAFMNWMAEIINVIGQGSLLCGTLLLRKKAAAR